MAGNTGVLNISSHATVRGLFAATLVAGAAMLLPRPAAAQITFDTIGPHEYDLPVLEQSWNVFVQYGEFQQSRQIFDRQGHRVDVTPNVQSTVGVSKWVHFFTLPSLPNVGQGFEVLQPEVNVRTLSSGVTNSSTTSGLGDTIIGWVGFVKPTSGSTVGFQTFLQIPDGSGGTSDTNWKNISSALWYVPFGEHFGMTGDAGWVVQSNKDNGVHPGLSWNTNNRFTWIASSTFEPFLALDYQYYGRSSVRFEPDLPSGHEFDGGAGLLIKYMKNNSISFRYSHAIDGKNSTVTNEATLEYVLVF
jgi:hypothetical protein